MPATPPAAPPSVQPVPPVPPPLPVPQSQPPSQATATAAVAGAANPTPARDTPVLAGTVIRVVDGDTLNVQLSSGPITVRLGSVDAPEYDQAAGSDAKAALARRLNGRQVELAVETQDQYERLVAIVYLGGENINSWLVQQGHAWAYRQYMSDPRYCVWEADARLYRRGLWAAPPGSQKAPWEWRRAQRDDGAFAFTDYQRETVSNCVKAMGKGGDQRDRNNPSTGAGGIVPAPASATGSNCRIKGNISESGKIYHVPGSDWYERTQINPAKGERWFCTEAEAKAAGWRAPR